MYHGRTMNRLRIIPLDDEVVFPGMPVTLPVDVGGDARVLLVPRQQNAYARVGVVERLTLALQFQRERLAELQVRKRIRDDVEDGAQKQQRDYFLRRQMDAIRKELGENDGSIADEYRQKISSAGMPDSVRQQAERELSRLERTGDSNAESSMIRTYLDWLLAVSWAKRAEERLGPAHGTASSQSR